MARLEQMMELITARLDQQLTPRPLPPPAVPEQNVNVNANDGDIIALPQKFS